MATPEPRACGPSRRRTFTAAEKLEFLAGYEAAITEQQGGAYLRVNGSTLDRSPNGAGYAAPESSKAKPSERGSVSSAQSKPKSHVYAASLR